MTTNFELAAPLPPKTKVRRYLFALVLSGLAVYFFLPRFGAMGQVNERDEPILNSDFEQVGEQ
jgi:hypothetical protein